MLAVSMVIAVSVFVVSEAETYCPSEDYVKCANQDELCVVSGTVRSGYVSYGANGKWNLIPFSNDESDGTDFQLNCEDELGDVYIGHSPKHCCYVEADTGFEGAFT